MLPLMASLREDSTPITTKAMCDIWNMNETRFSGTERCITHWDQVLLDNFTDGSPWNHFQLINLQTDTGRARVDGVASVVCDDPPDVVSVDAPLLGTKATMLTFDGWSFSTAGRSLLGSGVETATIEYAEDCNGNGVPDDRDIANGTSTDCHPVIDGDGIPDDCQCIWDVDANGQVDPFDYNFVMANFGCPVGTGNPDCDQADIDCNGVVDPFDSNAVMAHFGACP